MSSSSTTSESREYYDQLRQDFLESLCEFDKSLLPSQDDTCPVCMETYQDDFRMNYHPDGMFSHLSSHLPTKVDCGHTFGYNCIRTWLTADDAHTCPLCRYSFFDIYEEEEDLESEVDEEEEEISDWEILVLSYGEEEDVPPWRLPHQEREIGWEWVREEGEMSSDDETTCSCSSCQSSDEEGEIEYCNQEEADQHREDELYADPNGDQSEGEGETVFDENGIRVRFTRNWSFTMHIDEDCLVLTF